MDTDPRIVVDALVEMARQEELLAEARSALALGRRNRRDQGELAEEYGEDAAEAEGVRRRAETGFRGHVREIAALEAVLRTKRDRQVGLADRRQARALAEEIAGLERRLERLEAEAYALLDEADSRAAEAAEAVRGERKARNRREAAASDVAAARDRLDAAERESATEIERLLALLPRDVAGHVKRLRRGGDRAVVWVQDGACGGCRALLPPQQAIAVNRGRVLVRCASCSRYVVHKPWR